jgi:hypothetical protein
VGETGVVGAVFACREMMIYDFVLLNAENLVHCLYVRIGVEYGEAIKHCPERSWRYSLPQIYHNIYT